MFRQATVLGTLMIVAAAANAQDAASWGKSARQSYLDCSMVGSAARIMRTVSVNDIVASRACVDDRLKKNQESFGQVSSQKRPTAAAALKDYYAAWTAAMRALPSVVDQPHSFAEQAYSSSLQRLDELWARFEIESGGR